MQIHATVWMLSDMYIVTSRNMALACQSSVTAVNPSSHSSSLFELLMILWLSLVLAAVIWSPPANPEDLADMCILSSQKANIICSCARSYMYLTKWDLKKSSLITCTCSAWPGTFTIDVVIYTWHGKYLWSGLKITTMSCSDLSSIPWDIYITHLEYLTTFYEQKLLQNIECVYIYNLRLVRHFSWEFMFDMAQNAFSKHGKEWDALHNNTSHHNCNVNCSSL